MGSESRVRKTPLGLLLAALLVAASLIYARGQGESGPMIAALVTEGEATLEPLGPEDLQTAAPDSNPDSEILAEPDPEPALDAANPEADSAEELPSPDVEDAPPSGVDRLQDIAAPDAEPRQDPDSDPEPQPTTNPKPEARGPKELPISSMAVSPLELPLPPGRSLQPVDLANVLRLAGARDLDVATARARVLEAMAELQQAQALWLPSLYIGPSWVRHDGRLQDVGGRIFSASKSAGFAGVTAAGGASAAMPNPAGGPPPVSGLSTILRISDAIFEPMAAQQVVSARQASAQATANDAVFSAADSYLRLQSAAGQWAIAHEAAQHAQALADITEAWANSGKGSEADASRSEAELQRLLGQTERAIGEFRAASSELGRRVRLDARLVPAPVEPPESVLRIVDEATPVDALIVTGLTSRPELAQAQALVQATLIRLKQAKLRPFIPSLAVRASGGTFGGGVNNNFSQFGPRGDVDVNVFWQLENLGVGDHARKRARAAQTEIAAIELLKLQDRIAAEVVQAFDAVHAASARLSRASKAVPPAYRSLQLNLDNIRQAAGLPGAVRPIEALQPIQALATARNDYLEAVLAYNSAQFRLHRAIGRPTPLADLPAAAPAPSSPPTSVAPIPPPPHATPAPVPAPPPRTSAAPQARPYRVELD